MIIIRLIELFIIFEKSNNKNQNSEILIFIIRRGYDPFLHELN